MYVCIYTYVYIHIYMYIYIYVYVYIYIYLYTCVCVCVVTTARFTCMLRIFSEHVHTHACMNNNSWNKLKTCFGMELALHAVLSLE